MGHCSLIRICTALHLRGTELIVAESGKGARLPGNFINKPAGMVCCKTGYVKLAEKLCPLRAYNKTGFAAPCLRLYRHNTRERCYIKIA